MIRQDVYVDRYDWHVTIFYDAVGRDCDEILDALEDIHCPIDKLRKAEDLILSDKPNTGLTYSCSRCRKTVMVICRTTSVGEFFNTLSHEKQHIEQAFARYYGMNPYGEDIAYASGEICKAIFENAWHIISRMFRYVGEDIVNSYYRAARY